MFHCFSVNAKILSEEYVGVVIPVITVAVAKVVKRDVDFNFLLLNCSNGMF